MKYPNNLLSLRNQKGLQQGEVALGIKMKQPEYSKMERGERRIGDHISKICSFFQVDIDAIHGNQSNSASIRAKQTEDLPLFGMPVMNGEGVQLHKQFISYTMRPDYLDKNIDAYACFISGSMLSPRYEHGDLIYVDPSIKPQEGHFVVVQLKPNGKMIGLFRKLIKISDRQMKFKTINPQREHILKNSDILYVHTISGSRTNFY